MCDCKPPELMLETIMRTCRDKTDLLCEALIYRFRTLGNMTGWQLIRSNDADQLALLALAGDETVGGLDETYANILVCHPRIRMKIETTRVRNTKPLK